MLLKMYVDISVVKQNGEINETILNALQTLKEYKPKKINIILLYQQEEEIFLNNIIERSISIEKYPSDKKFYDNFKHKINKGYVYIHTDIQELIKWDLCKGKAIFLTSKRNKGYSEGLTINYYMTEYEIIEKLKIYIHI